MRSNVIRRCGDAVLFAWFAWTLGFQAYQSVHNFASDDKPIPIVSGTWSSWKSFPARFETAFNNQFGSRDLLVRRHARYKLERLHVSPTPRVLFGKGGWLYYNHNADANFMKPTDPRLDARLRAWADSLSAWRDWFAVREIKMLVVVVPDKQSVYPEYLPPAERHRHVEKSLDRFLRLAGRDPELIVLDLRKSLRDAKSVETVYRFTDTHWTPAGAHIGYVETAHALKKWFPAITPMPIDDFDRRLEFVDRSDLCDLIPVTVGDGEMVEQWEPRNTALAKTVKDEPAISIPMQLPHVKPALWQRGAPAVAGTAEECETPSLPLPRLGGEEKTRPSYNFGGPRQGPARAEARGHRTLPRVVLFHDSFGDEPYRDWLAEHCSRLVAIPSYFLDEKLIEAEKPDVVVVQFAERMLQGITPKGPEQFRSR